MARGSLPRPLRYRSLGRHEREDQPRQAGAREGPAGGHRAGEGHQRRDLQGRAEEPDRVPLRWEHDFMDVFYWAWWAILYFLEAGAAEPSPGRLIEPAQRQLVKVLVGHRTTSVFEVVEALEPIAQPELLVPREFDAGLSSPDAAGEAWRRDVATGAVIAQCPVRPEAARSAAPTPKPVTRRPTQEVITASRSSRLARSPKALDLTPRRGSAHRVAVAAVPISGTSRSPPPRRVSSFSENCARLPPTFRRAVVSTQQTTRDSGQDPQTRTRVVGTDRRPAGRDRAYGARPRGGAPCRHLSRRRRPESRRAPKPSAHPASDDLGVLSRH